MPEIAPVTFNLDKIPEKLFERKLLAANKDVFMAAAKLSNEAAITNQTKPPTAEHTAALCSLINMEDVMMCEPVCGARGSSPSWGTR